MSKVERLSLEEIFNQTDVILRQNDIIYFCEDLDVIQSFVEISSKSSSYKAIKEFLIEHEEYINKEKLVILLIKNYTDNLQVIDERKRELKETVELSDLTKTEEIKEFRRLNIQEKVQSENLKKAMRLARGIDVIIPFYSYNVSQKRYEVDVVDSKELVDGKTINSSASLKRFKSIDEYFKSKERKETREEQADLGIEYILQSLILTDFYEIFSDQQLGEHIRTMVLENAILQQGIKTAEELEEIKSNDYLKYVRITDNCDFHSLLPEVKKALQEHIQYVDIDKLLLISAYRFEEGLENGSLKGNKAIAAKELIIAIVNNIKNEKVKFSGILQRKEGNDYIDQTVTYSVQDIYKCLGRFTGTEYLSKELINGCKEQLKNGEINLLEMNNEYVDICCSPLDVEILSIQSDENFKYALSKLEWNKEKIVEMLDAKGGCSTDLLRDLIIAEIVDSKDIINLYLNGKISIEQIQEIQDISDLSENVNSYELIQYYKNSIEKDSTEEDKEKFDRYTELYKDTLSKIEDKEELEERNNELVNNLLDIYQGEEYINVAEDFYKKGLVPLEILAEWNGENIIDRFYKEQIITFEDIDKSDLNIEIKQSILGKIIMNNIENYSQDELLVYIYKRYLSEEDIFKICKSALLNETYTEDMLNQGIISARMYIKILNIGKEILEEQADTKFSDLGLMGTRNFSINLIEDEMEESNISIGDVPISKKKNEQDDNEKSKVSKYNISTRTSETLIDPSIRWDFLKALKCKLPKDREINNQDPNNPFYNYEFFVIESDNDYAEKDSIVIGERFFKDKYTEEEYATSNATYIWQYKDYLIAQRMLKTEQKKNKKAVLQETEGVVYVANHRPGSWAVSLLYKIAQAKAGESFDKYKKGDERASKVIEHLEKLYTQEELTKILDLAKIIDDEQKIKMSNGEEVGIVYDVIKEDKRIVSHDTDDGR